LIESAVFAQCTLDIKHQRTERNGTNAGGIYLYLLLQNKVMMMMMIKYL